MCGRGGNAEITRSETKATPLLSNSGRGLSITAEPDPLLPVYELSTHLAVDNLSPDPDPSRGRNEHLLAPRLGQNIIYNKKHGCDLAFQGSMWRPEHEKILEIKP